MRAAESCERCIQGVHGGSLGVVTSPGPLGRLRGALLAQCAADEVRSVRALVARPGSGMVITTSDPATAWQLASVRPAGERLLLDASRYTGTRRVPASAPFRPRWLALQRDLGLPVLTDSGYVAPGDVQGLRSLLSQAAHLGSNVIAMLPLASWWLDGAGGLPTLLDQVRRAGVPIAVALEHRNDPLGVGRTLRGVLQLLEVGPPVIQLRCDVSALGLLCYGAWAAAVGTRSSLRHFYPLPTGGGGPPRRAKTSTVVRECMSYVDVDRIARGIQAEPEDSLWQACPCQVCRGRQLDWISTLPTGIQRERAAAGHALEALLELRDGLLVNAGSPDDRASWYAQCDNALTRYEQLNHLDGTVTVPGFLRAWRSVALRSAPRAAQRAPQHGLMSPGPGSGPRPGRGCRGPPRSIDRAPCVGRVLAFAGQRRPRGHQARRLAG